MKVPETNYFKTTAIVLGVVLPIAVINNRCERNEVENIKTEMKEKDSLRYKRLQSEMNGLDFFDQKLAWKYELEDMNDSLKKAAAAQKAYFEGTQMVKDSISKK